MPPSGGRTEMKRATIGTLAIVFMLVAIAEAGNFNHFKELMEAGKFQQSEPVEGFSTWQKVAIKVGIHTSMGGNCDSGIIVIGNKAKAEDIYIGIKAIYFCLQWSLAIAGKDAVDPETKNMTRHLDELMKQLNNNMQSHTNKFSFDFDDLVVNGKRGETVTILIYIPN
jgi:hypothetical protein